MASVAVFVALGGSAFHGLGAKIAIQNSSRHERGTAPPIRTFAGDASVGRCASETINCVPAGTNEDDTLVVPRGCPHRAWAGARPRPACT